jgi:hypothetical protein
MFHTTGFNLPVWNGVIGQFGNIAHGDKMEPGWENGIRRRMERYVSYKSILNQIPSCNQSMDWFQGKSSPETIDFPFIIRGFPVKIFP